jgi:hypothetical protein
VTVSVVTLCATAAAAVSFIESRSAIV